ncbi:STAS/SEC14 domain-containing protein [Streptomyces caniferus]
MPFIRDHHRKVGKIALAADSRTATLVPQLANRFVQAEVRRFEYDELNDALAWAADPPTR